jgi:ketosteroid isomerase-like protein
MRTFLIGGALGALVLALAACGSSSASSTSQQTLQRQADLWAIDQIEKNFHKAISRKDIEVMMRLWAPNATLTLGPGRTAAGKKQIRQYWLKKSKNFQPTNHWVSETLAYKVRITANGDRGTLFFECHYIDWKTHEHGPITAADMDVARIDGRWLITNMVGASARLSP